MDIKALTSPVGIVRIFEVILNCITFGLVVSIGTTNLAFWVWPVFTWCFCFSITFIILVLEFTQLNAKLPISWEDFTMAYAVMATLMMLSSSIIYPKFYATLFNRAIGATVTSILAFILYAVEVALTRAKHGEITGFLRTVPGLLKVVETFVACVIFICLDGVNYNLLAALQWCVAVYSICFIFNFIVVIAAICRLLPYFPTPIKKILIGCNVLAVLMYMTAVVIWPYYSLRNSPRPSYCSTPNILCLWDNFVVITFLTCFNLVVYIVDTVFSTRLTFVSET